MIDIDDRLKPSDLVPAIERMWELSAPKLLAIEDACGPGTSSPVFTVKGQYTAQGWTEWTQGFQFGSLILQFDATGDRTFLDLGRHNTVQSMASHVSHIGVHDHGFNNVSTYGNLRRLMGEGRFAFDQSEWDFYELALKLSGAVQAARWSRTHEGDGYIYSFNGPHSLFCDTIRSLRSLALAFALDHVLMGENDESICLLGRLIEHARTTARYNVFYGEGRDVYDLRGRVAHESIFNTVDGRYRCPSTQQGYSAFTTWTRGLAWVVTGYAEQLEFLATLTDEAFAPYGGRTEVEAMMQRAATAACDFYLEQTPANGVPYWDTGAPGLANLGNYLERPADPYNDHEPVDSSAAAITAQGLLRFGRYLKTKGETDAGNRYAQAGLTVLQTLLSEPYLSTDAKHQGLLLHSIYFRPRGWDHRPGGAAVPHSESSMWGDYHLREAALLAQRLAADEPYPTFFSTGRAR